MSRRGGRNSNRSNQIVDQIVRNADSLLKMEDIENFIALSEQFGKFCARNNISTSQIRAIFQVVKRLPESFETSKNELNLLRPRLAYQRGRFPQLSSLTDVIDSLIKKVKNDETLKGFKQFFEAIIAYHKAYGGKD